jgi:hypothetical protein
MTKMLAGVNKARLRIPRIAAGVLLLLLFTMNLLPSQIDEYQLKLLLICQIANRYIEWPAETGIANQNKPFVIGLVGETPFGMLMEQAYNRFQQPLKVKNKNVVLRNIKHVEQIPGCHLLFISDLPGRLLARLDEFTHAKPVLTIADSVDFVDEGIHISFLLGKTPMTSMKPGISSQITGEGKPNIALVINDVIARQSGLLIGEDLLKIATDIVMPFRACEEKANFLESFSRFIDWPPASGQDDRSKPFKIEVLGHNYLGSYLDKVFKKKTLKNKPVVVRCISDINEINRPHILFISKAMKENISKIIAYTKNKPILTIGDTQGFRQVGVHINFFYDQLALSFEINEEAAKAVGFNISWHLLQLAKTDTSH